MNYLGIFFTLLITEKIKNFVYATYGFVFILIPLLLFLERMAGMVKMASKLTKQ